MMHYIELHFIILLCTVQEECLDLPPLIRRRVLMPVSSDVQAEYQAIIQKFKAQSQQQQGYEGYDGGGSSGLEMVSALRKLTSAAKVSYRCIFTHPLVYGV